MTIEERRSSQRASVAVSVVEEYLSEEQNVTAINISEHGMHYRRPLDQRRRVGEEVLLTFSLLERLRPIKALSWIVEEREESSHISTHVTFMFLPEKDEDTIRDFVDASTSS